MKKPTEVVLAEMDEAAAQAAKDLENVEPESVALVAAWWKMHFLKAGHKRLGRILVNQV